MNAIGATILLILILVVLSASKRWAVMGMIAGVLFLTQGEQISVGGFNMFAMRFLEIAGIIRVLSRGEFSFSKLNNIDRALLLLYCYTTIVFLLRSSDSQAYQIGLAVDAFLCYFTFRGLIKTVKDWNWFLGAFLLMLAPYVALVLLESRTSQNPFVLIGGRVATEEWFREGRIRCFGTFAHPSLLGTLGGSFLPIYISQFFTRRRAIACVGIVLCLAIIYAVNSGGPVTCVVVGMAGWLLWPARTKMQWVRRGLSATIILLGIFMKSPIWYLLAKLSDLTGGDGYHRSYLMDVAYQNLGKWWLIGMPIQNTITWFPYQNGATGVADITNAYLWYGLQGGLLSVILFVVLLTRAFRRIGETLAKLRSDPEGDDTSQYLFWGLGVTLTVHLMNWFGITYYDQTYVVWFMQLAVISSLTEKQEPFEQTGSGLSQKAKVISNSNQARARRYPLAVPSRRFDATPRDISGEVHFVSRFRRSRFDYA